MSDVGRIFRENLKALRKQRGISQDALAKAMHDKGFGFYQPTIERIERGARPVRIAEAVALCRFFGVDLVSMVMTSAPVPDATLTSDLITASVAAGRMRVLSGSGGRSVDLAAVTS